MEGLIVLCRRVPVKEFIKAFKTLPRLRTKVNNFHRQMSSSNNSEDDYAAIRSEWTTVDRILACRFIFLESCFSNDRYNSMLLVLLIKFIIINL